MKKTSQYYYKAIYKSAYCDCATCFDAEKPCQGDCDAEDLCQGCLIAAEQREDTLFEIDCATGRR